MDCGDGLATADRHRVKHTGRLFGIFDKGREKRRLVSRLNPAKNVQVQFHKVFLIVENAATNPQIVPCDFLDRALGHQIGVQLGAHARNQAAKFGAVVLGQKGLNLILPASPVQVFGQDF